MTGAVVDDPSGGDAGELWSRVAELLRQRGDRVVETHISLVILAGERVYKLKKPVRFAFVDFATSQARRAAAEREVALNRRLARDVYRGVVPVTLEGDGRLALGGSGRPIEWVVEMRRLPEGRMLEPLIREGRVEPRQVEQLAAMLADFYGAARRIALPRGELAARALRHVQDNRLELLQPRHGLDRELVERISNRQLQLLALRADAFDERVAGGFVVDGHGDLRPEHVCMEDEPVVFDCLEFNDELREVDVADDLGFFAMECERLGAPWIAERITTAYQSASGDPLPEDLQAFYRSYRATVRAKVAVLTAAQKPSGDGRAARQLAEAYLRLADRSLGPAAEPLAVIFRGLTGSGKSTVAVPLAERLGARLVQTDRVRRQLFGPSPRPLAYGEGHYGEAGRARVYEETLASAAAALAARISVVVDGCFLSQEGLRAAARALQAAGGRPFVVHCVCPEAVARARVVARAQSPERLSEATGEHLTAQQAKEEPTPKELAGIVLDTGGKAASVLAGEVVRALTGAAAMREALPPASPRVRQEARAGLPPRAGA